MIVVLSIFRKAQYVRQQVIRNRHDLLPAAGRGQAALRHQPTPGETTGLGQRHADEPPGLPSYPARRSLRPCEPSQTCGEAKQVPGPGFHFQSSSAAANLHPSRARPPATMRATQLSDFGTDQSPIITGQSSNIRIRWNRATKAKIAPATRENVLRFIERACQVLRAANESMAAPKPVVKSKADDALLLALLPAQ